MNHRSALAVTIVLIVVLGVPLSPAPLPVGGVPVKVAQVHIQNFSDGSDAVDGLGGELGHMVFEFDVPAGGQVFCATLEISRLRYSVVEIPLDTAARSLWCGDLDGDGYDDDVVLAYPEAGRVDVMSLEGEPATLVLKTSLDVPDATAVILDDLDRDRDKDLLVTSGSQGRLYVFETIGVATYAAPHVIPVGLRPGSIAVQDLDPDFRRDVVVANAGGSSVTVLMGRGDLLFYPKLVEVGRGPSSVQLRDVDRDLDIDLIVAESRNDTVTVLYNEGNGNFSNATALPTGTGPVDVDVKDMNGDSLVDIAVACSGTNETWVYRQIDGRTFELWEVLETGGAPRAVGAFHLNRGEDLNRDLVTACSGSDNLTVYMSDGSLNHTIHLEVPVGGRPVDVGILQGQASVGDTIIALCQVPPSLVIAMPLPVAELIHVGFGNGGGSDQINLPMGTERQVVSIAEGLTSYVSRMSRTAIGGVLPVRMEAWGIKEGWLRVEELDVWIRQNRPPRADAGRNVTVVLGEPAELNGSASYDQDGGTLQHLWYLPGDTTDPSYEQPVVNHTFTEPGTHMVFLVVMDRWGLQDQDQVAVRVNAPPLARGTVPDSVRAREPARLSAHLSEDPDGTIEDYIWDYSLGVVHGRTVDVLFTGAGIWNVTLEVVDDEGAKSTRVWQVEVLPSEIPLRPPGEQRPEDEGEVPGPGPVLVAMAILLATLLTSARRRP